MPRCNDCNKFVSLDSDQEPEIDLDVDDDGVVTGSVQIANACAECSTEIRTASFDVNVEPESLRASNDQTLADFLAGLTDEGRENAEIEVNEIGNERTSRTEGKGRGARTFYGAKVEIEVTVKIEGDPEKGQISYSRTFSGTFEDEVQASAMDEA